MIARRLLENLSSQSLWPRVLLLGASVALVGSSASCIIVTEDDDDHPPPPGPSPSGSDIAQVNIDEGATIPLEPGDGVGFFVEYVGDGRWRLLTTCDTAFSGFSCAFDAVVQAPRPEIVSSLDLEVSDGLYTSNDALYFQPNTSYGSDGVVFDTEPGASVRVDVFLDGIAQPRFIYWVGDGVLHAGAPTNPVDFLPTTDDPGQGGSGGDGGEGGEGGDGGDGGDGSGGDGGTGGAGGSGGGAGGTGGGG